MGSAAVAVAILLLKQGRYLLMCEELRAPCARPAMRSASSSVTGSPRTAPTTVAPSHGSRER